MAFKVLTLDSQTFTEKCIELRQMVADDGFKPDLVVSIPRGGDSITDIACKNDNLKGIALIRTTRNIKAKEAIMPILRFVPKCVKDLLRMLGAKYLKLRRGHMKKVGIALPDECMTAQNILVVDDAVDSGATLKAVMDKIRDANPEADIRSAVLNVTAAKPLIEPDYCIFNRTIIRFPWSIDN